MESDGRQECCMHACACVSARTAQSPDAPRGTKQRPFSAGPCLRLGRLHHICAEAATGQPHLRALKCSSSSSESASESDSSAVGSTAASGDDAFVDTVRMSAALAPRAGRLKGDDSSRRICACA